MLAHLGGCWIEEKKRLRKPEGRAAYRAWTARKTVIAPMPGVRP